MNNINQQAVAKSVRKTWGFSPVSRKVESKKGYRRKEKFNKGWN